MPKFKFEVVLDERVVSRVTNVAEVVVIADDEQTARDLLLEELEELEDDTFQIDWVQVRDEQIDADVTSIEIAASLPCGEEEKAEFNFTEEDER